MRTIQFFGNFFGLFFRIHQKNKKMEENLRQLQKENHGLKIDLQNAQMEMKNQKKILEMEIGSDFVNSSQLLGNGFKGRNQQIIALQSRVKELERIKGWL